MPLGSLGSSSSRINILVVDDYEANLIALGAVLSDPIYNLIEATSGPEALAALEKNDVALILLDVQMPAMDGYEVAKRIRANPRTQDIPIIFITAVYREAPSVRQGYEAGGQDYLGKPFDPEILKAKVGVYSNLFMKNLELERERRRLKESEERYRLIVEGAQEVIATVDHTGTITSLNLAFERLTALQCKDWIGKSFVPLLPADDLPEVLKRFSASSDPGDPGLFQTKIKVSSGRFIPVEISVQPLRRDGETLGMVGVIRDISSRSASTPTAP